MEQYNQEKENLEKNLNELNEQINKENEIINKYKNKINEIQNEVNEFNKKVEEEKKEKENLEAKNAESILLAKTHIDYRNAQKKDLAENFTIKNLYTLDELNKKDVDTKSAILAPYNSMLSEEENGNISSSRRKESLCDILDNFNDELEIKNGIIKFHGKAKEFNMNYELNNNEEIDNGMLINSKNDLISLEDNEIKDSEKNIYLVKNNDASDKNKNTNLQNKKHRPSSPYRPPPINKDFVKMVSDLGYDEDYVIKCLEKKELNHATTIYYLFSNYENVK